MITTATRSGAAGSVSNVSASAEAIPAPFVGARTREQRRAVMSTHAASASVIRQVQLIIGTLVLSSAALAYFVHPAFVGIAAFFGAGLVLAGATGLCGLAVVVGMMPWNRRASGSPCETAWRL